MADGIPITAGIGTTVLTDDTGAGGHAQVVKLAIATDGSGTLIPAVAATGLLVNDGRKYGATATLSNVNDSDSSASLLASNASRLGVTVQNDSTTTLYLKYGATASPTSYTVKIPAGAYWEMPYPIYTGPIDGIWSADAAGAARLTELTA